MIGYTKRRMRLCVALLTADLLFIWGNSLMPASVSGAISQWIRDLIGLLFAGDKAGGESDGLLRKIAHFLEFCSLGLCLSWLTGMRLKTLVRSVTLSLACGFAAACMDEALQHLSPGRAPRFTDIMIDTAGVAVGIILLWIGYKHIKKQKTLLEENNNEEDPFPGTGCYHGPVHGCLHQDR